MGTTWLCRPWALAPSRPLLSLGPSGSLRTWHPSVPLVSALGSCCSGLLAEPLRAPVVIARSVLCISAATALLLLTSVSDIHAGLCATYMLSTQLSVKAHRSSGGWPWAPRVPINVHEEQMGGGRDWTGQEALVLQLFPHRSALPASSSEATTVTGEVGGVGPQGSVQGLRGTRGWGGHSWQSLTCSGTEGPHLGVPSTETGSGTSGLGFLQPGQPGAHMVEKGPAVR